jgi:hypothetical protein
MVEFKQGTTTVVTTAGLGLEQDKTSVLKLGVQQTEGCRGQY